jgi:cyanophycin synthetase
MRGLPFIAPREIGTVPASMIGASCGRLFGRALQGYYLGRRLASDRRHPKVAMMLRHRDEFYARAWHEAAQSVGARIVSIGGHFFQITLGRRSIVVNRNYSALDNQVSVMLADDKRATYRMLTDAVIPVPGHIVITLSEAARGLAFLGTTHSPLVVKPAAGTGGGEGVSTNVTSASQLRVAIAWAAAFSREVLIERQIEGETCRLLYLDGDLLDCVVRRSPRLVGDGRASVRQLVRRENRLRVAAGCRRSQVLLRVDQDMASTLALQGLALGAIPAAGEQFTVKQVVNENTADENETASDRVCPAIVELGRRVLATMGLRLAGIDVMVKDLGRPLDESGGAVIDVNAIPGFYYHYHKKDGCVPVARLILRRAFAAAA